jgi:hypothetical protein
VDVLIAAVLGALATAVIGPLMLASVEVRRHDEQVAERDDDLEEWIVVRDRALKRRWNEIEQQARAAGVEHGGSIAAGRVATQTQLLYEYREELRKARAFIRSIQIEERWTHRLVRVWHGRVRPLTTPTRAERLVEFWYEGTAHNALTWSLDDILGELPARTPSRARAVGSEAA